MHTKSAILLILSALCFALPACSVRALHEACNIVTTADSLRAAGQAYADSAHLAKAYTTLGRWRWFYPDEYAHSCYYYGRLLREKEDPVAAMKCFIAATHSRTNDYHILGRVYSNMGDLCHQAANYELSYDMFENSATCFLRRRDSVAYYYALNDMAFEKAQQEKLGEAVEILSHVEQECRNSNVLALTTETKAVAYLYAQLYDSAISYAKMYLHLTNEPSGLIVCAQAYSFAGFQDSASYYAQQVMLRSEDLFHQNNALYILTNDDNHKSTEEVRKLSADRADIQKLIETRHGELSQAVQLLEQDLLRKPNYTWLYAIIATIIVIGGGIGLYVVRKHKKHRLLTQQLIELETKKEEVSIQHKMIVAQHTSYEKDLIKHINQECEVFRKSDNLQRDLCWTDYIRMCEIGNSQFHMLVSKLQQTNRLNKTEIRLCVLVLIGFNRTEISNILPYALSSVGKLKDQTAKKLGTSGKKLRDYLLKLAVGG